MIVIIGALLDAILASLQAGSQPVTGGLPLNGREALAVRYGAGIPGGPGRG